MTFNETKLQQVVDAAKQKVNGNPRWMQAIRKAHRQLLLNPYIFDKTTHMVIASDSGQVYHVNGTCQCEAFKYGKPCWHRCVAQLVKRYNEV